MTTADQFLALVKEADLSSPVESGFDGEITSLEKSLKAAKVVVRNARIALIEQVFTLALRLPAKDVETARNLVKPHLGHSP